MPTNVNIVTIAGSLTRDPEVRNVGSDNVVCNFGLAINKKYKGKEETVFCDVECWQRTAELCGQYLTRGRNCLIEGELAFSQWEKDGQKRSKLFIKAQRVHFIGGMDSNSKPDLQQGSVSNAMSQNDKAGEPITDDEQLPPF